MFAFRAVVVLMARELPPGETVFLWEVLMAAGDHLTEPELEEEEPAAVVGGGRWRNHSGAGGDENGATTEENENLEKKKKKKNGEEEADSSSSSRNGNRSGNWNGDGDEDEEEDGAGVGAGVGVASDQDGARQKLRVFRPADGAGGGLMFLHVVAAAFLHSRNVVFGCHELDDLLHASHHTIASKNTGASALLASARRLMVVQS